VRGRFRNLIGQPLSDVSGIPHFSKFKFDKEVNIAKADNEMLAKMTSKDGQNQSETCPTRIAICLEGKRTG